MSFRTTQNTKMGFKFTHFSCIPLDQPIQFIFSKSRHFSLNFIFTYLLLILACDRAKTWLCKGRWVRKGGGDCGFGGGGGIVVSGRDDMVPIGGGFRHIILDSLDGVNWHLTTILTDNRQIAENLTDNWHLWWAFTESWVKTESP